MTYKCIILLMNLPAMHQPSRLNSQLLKIRHPARSYLLQQKVRTNASGVSGVHVIAANYFERY